MMRGLGALLGITVIVRFVRGAQSDEPEKDSRAEPVENVRETGREKELLRNEEDADHRADDHDCTEQVAERLEPYVGNSGI